MHPMVKPALRRGWRDLNTVQFGMAPAHAMVLGPMDTATGSFLALLDGTRGLPLLREEARRTGLPEGHLDALVDNLSTAGLLDDATGGGPQAQALRAKTAVLDRLRPDLASLSLTTRAPGEPGRRLAARRSLRVQVRGAGRVGAVLAALLAGAGVGEVDVCDTGHVEPWDVAPGGLPADSVGERREEAARRAVRAAAPDRPPRRQRPSRRSPHNEPGPALSLVILAPRDGVDIHAPDPFAAEPLIASGTPHLYAGVVEGTGVVGPFVLPGDTSCAGCLHRGRADRDETWPRLVAQWRSGRPPQVQPCDLALATAVAGVAAGHALAFLDGEVPSSAGARWEAGVPRLDWHARPVWPHPACPCGAAERGKGEHTSQADEPHETMAERRPSRNLSRKAHAARLSGTWRAHV
ncbi:TOMM precursor leader peptide-binding protein [Streptomyces chiangmaiensis]|uniref:TOMM leader peptide-binding protein n=1 Tax=Streptomyces chiangmaiensis TaxID=766497 RepID=A0ABU7FUL2_9ACTN|nr:TOMM precursor leader peptide-binding protein [Streptomyces chiangmaiensis]MED7826794.1 TOMM precursor leader peptide-binding protein [Streptomyces chiangmaiensis]